MAVGRDQSQLSVPGVPLWHWGLVLQLGCLCSIKMTTQAGISPLQVSIISSVKGGEIPKPAFLVAEHWEGQLRVYASGTKASWQVGLELHHWRQFLSGSLFLTYCLMDLYVCPDLLNLCSFGFSLSVPGTSHEPFWGCLFLHIRVLRPLCAVESPGCF